jgi:Mg2+ and Co2+ transporter CorA
MLPTDIPLDRRAWRGRLAAFLLSEALIGFLAIGAAALTLFPMWFAVSPGVDRLLESAQWVIIGWLGVEYLLGLAWAPDKRAFLLNPWRWVDLATVVVPLATLLPGVSNVLRSSTLLRLVRLLRVLSLGARAGVGVVREQTRRAVEAAAGPAELAVLSAERATQKPVAASWAEFLEWIRAPGEQWFHVSNPGPDQLKTLVHVAGLPPAEAEAWLGGSSYPRLDVSGSATLLFAWLPERLADGSRQRNGVLLLANRNGLFTLSRYRSGLLDSIAGVLPRLKLEGRPFAVRMIGAFLQMVLDRYEEWVGECELELRALEEVPVRESRPVFFERCFRLKKELSTAHFDLWRLKGLLAGLAEGRVRLPGGGAEAAFWRGLEEAAGYLYETAANTREGVLALIDLHLNVVSFEMNRVMRVLAVVSVLGLIPAVVAGLLGMNLADNPWPFTLPQVAFGVGLGMVLCLYLFLVKGWLR